jgi:ferric-dicitrate binding protein FerR (iron transport regulator)
MSKQHDNEPGDDASIEELLRSVGARTEPSPELTNEVREAVHAEWRAMLAERSRRRSVYAYALAASVVLAIAVVLGAMRWMVPESGPIATIARVDGSQPTAPRVGEQITIGETLQTDDKTRIALSFADGLSLRVDSGSSITLVAADRVLLVAGALYIDSDPSRPQAKSLEIETIAGVVRHLGTQYQVRQGAQGVVLSIREGRVEISGDHGVHHVSAGELLRIAPDGSMDRAPLASHDPSWDWASAAAPAFDINNRVLSDFLDWVARETGKRIVYATPQALDAARGVVLRGSIGNLDPESALAPVLSTTELRRFETDATSIGIELTAQVEAR